MRNHEREREREITIQIRIGDLLQKLKCLRPKEVSLANRYLSGSAKPICYIVIDIATT